MTISAAPAGRFGSAFDWLGVERAWTRTRGSAAVVIGIVDQGVQLDHPLLGPNIQNHAHPTVAAGEHEIAGTYAAGVAAGPDIERFPGVAPDARILPVRYGTGTGTGPQTPDLAHAIEFAVEFGAHIVNLGQDAELDTPAVRRAVQYAATRNALVVCPASRHASAPAGEEPPPNLIRVLSVDERLEPLAGDAAHGDIAAPGFARVPHWHGTGHTSLTHAALGAPYVSGCAALVKALNPDWGYHELREHLLASGTSRPELMRHCAAGRMLHVADAVLGPLALTTDAHTLHWSSLSDAPLSWQLRYRSAYCINAVALYRPHGDDHWRELGFARAASLHMVVPAASLRRSSGTLRIASREANFHSEEAALTIR
jgi:hypothetical protein